MIVSDDARCVDHEQGHLVGTMMVTKASITMGNNPYLPRRETTRSAHVVAILLAPPPTPDNEISSCGW